MPRTRKTERISAIPSTTVLKLFVYPEKDGTRTYCVGFERNNNGFVGQQFLSPWTTIYESAITQYERWRDALGIYD